MDSAQKKLSQALADALKEANDSSSALAGISDTEGRPRDPRINFNVCITHCCEEAMEALDCARQLQAAMVARKSDDSNKIWDPTDDEIIRLAVNFLEELGDVIYATRRMCFYALEEKKPMNDMTLKMLNSIHGDYTGFRAKPYSNILTCSIHLSLYTIRVLRTQNIGYPTRHDFESEFPKYLDAIREVLRYLIYVEVPQLIKEKILDDTWKEKVRDWIVYKIIRKRKADLLEGNIYYDGGY